MAAIAADAISAARIDEYDRYHSRRFAAALATCLAFQPDRAASVLDIGRSSFTDTLRQHYTDVSTLGFAAAGITRHIAYDLNDAGAPIPTDQRFGLVTFNEVIEHLYTAPELVLAELAHVMLPSAVMVVQTPNAVSLNKRIIMLAGRNPYERLRADRTNPGHFRELTKAELIDAARWAGLEPISHSFAEYCEAYGGGWKQAFGVPTMRAIAALAPSLARSQMIVLRKH